MHRPFKPQLVDKPCVELEWRGSASPYLVLILSVKDRKGAGVAVQAEHLRYRGHIDHHLVWRSVADVKYGRYASEL